MPIVWPVVSRGIVGAPLVEDCILGGKTEQALISFQRIVFPGKPVEHDGKLGPHTWAEFDRVAATIPVPPPLTVPAPPTSIAALWRQAGATLRDGYSTDLDKPSLNLLAASAPSAPGVFDFQIKKKTTELRRMDGDIMFAVRIPLREAQSRHKDPDQVGTPTRTQRQARFLSPMRRRWASRQPGCCVCPVTWLNNGMPATGVKIRFRDIMQTELGIYRCGEGNQLQQRLQSRRRKRRFLTVPSSTGEHG